MATTTMRGTPVHTAAELPRVGQPAPRLELTDGSLAQKTLDDFPGKRIVSVFPSIDTPTCAMSVRTFTERATGLPGVTVLNVSADLPFAAKRFCAAEGLEGVHTLSTFRSDFGDAWGTRIVDGPMRGLQARAVFVVDEQGVIRHAQLVDDIAKEPDYDAALAAL